MSRESLFFTPAVGMILSQGALAGTLRVPTDALIINSGLEAIDYNDRQPDVVEVAPGVGSLLREPGV